MYAENQPAAEVVDHPFGGYEGGGAFVPVWGNGTSGSEYCGTAQREGPSGGGPGGGISASYSSRNGVIRFRRTASVRPMQSRWPRSRRVIGMPWRHILIICIKRSRTPRLIKIWIAKISPCLEVP